MTREEELNAFQVSIAQAMTAWSIVEISLCMLFSMFLFGREGVPQAAAIFYAIENFRSKLQALDALAVIVLNGTALEKWSTLEKRAAKRVGKRNRIAHHEVMYMESAEPGKRYGLIRPMLAPSTSFDLASGKEKPMHLHELKEAIAEFSSLGTELRDFMVFLKKEVSEAMAQWYEAALKQPR